jgi:hypothetical protein
MGAKTALSKHIRDQRAHVARSLSDFAKTGTGT